MAKFEGSFGYNPLAAEVDVPNYSPLEVEGVGDDAADEAASSAAHNYGDNEGADDDDDVNFDDDDGEDDDGEDDDDDDENDDENNSADGLGYWTHGMSGLGAADAEPAYRRLARSPQLTRTYAKMKIKFFNSARKRGIPQATVRMLDLYRRINQKWGIPVRASLAMTFHGKTVHFRRAKAGANPRPSAGLRMLNEIIAMSYHLANRV